MQWDTVNEVERKSQAEKDEGRGVLGPGERYCHTLNLVSLGGERWVFAVGGTNCARKQVVGVCKYDTGRELWKRPKLSGPQPPPRESHTCTTVGHKLFVFGGRNSEATLGDLHILDTDANQWITPETTGDAPCPREGHAAVSVDQLVYVFGGCRRADKENEDDLYFDDVYRLETETLTWQKLETSGGRPSARTGHSMVAWDSSLIVFGGQDADDQPLNDIFALDTEMLVWTKLQPRGELPAPRAGHVSALVGSQLIIFGGVDKGERKLLNDICVLDLDTLVWRRQAARGAFPRHRFSAASALVDARGGDLLIYGGCDEELAPTSGFFVLLTGLGQSGPDVKRLAKHTPRAPAPPLRPAKRRKTVISSFSGQTARVDTETAARYFEAVSRIADQLGMEALSTEQERAGGGSAAGGARETGEGSLPRVFPAGELGAGERLMDPFLGGGLERRENGGGGVSRQEGNEGEREEGERFENDGHIREVQKRASEKNDGSCPGEKRSTVPDRGSEVINANGTRGESLHVMSLGVKPSNQGRSEAREGVSRNGCTGLPPGEKGEKRPPGTVRGGGKTLVSAGVQTIYSARELHYRPTGLVRAKKLVPVRRGTKATANGGPQGDPPARMEGVVSPEIAGAQVRVASTEEGTGRRENGRTGTGNGIRETEGTPSKSCHAPREESLRSVGLCGVATSAATPVENGNRVGLAIDSHAERDEGQSAAQEGLSNNYGISRVEETAAPANEINERDSLTPGLGPASLLPPNRERPVLPTPPQSTVLTLTPPESGVRNPLLSREPGPAAAAGPHLQHCPSDLSANSSDLPKPGVTGSVPDLGRAEAAYSHRETAPSPTPHAAPAGPQYPDDRPPAPDPLQPAADVSNDHLDCHASHLDSSRVFGCAEAAPPRERREAAEGAYPRAEAAPHDRADGAEIVAGERFGGWALIKVPEIKEEPPKETIDIKIEDLLQTGFSISAAVGGQQLRGFLYSSNPKFLAIAQVLALKKRAEDQQAAAIAAAERKAARILEKKAKEERKLEAARAAQEALRIAAEARAEKAALRKKSPPVTSNPNPLAVVPVDQGDRVHLPVDQPVDPAVEIPVLPNPSSTCPARNDGFSPPVKVLSPVGGRKGRKREPGAKKGRTRARPQTGRGYLANYPPNLHMQMQMPVVMHQPMPVVMRPPMGLPGHPSESAIAPGGEQVAVENICPPIDSHGTEANAINQAVEDAGAEMGPVAEGEMEHVAVEEGMDIAAESGHAGQEIMLYEEPVMDQFAPGLDPDREHLEAPFVEGSPGELATGQQLLGEEHPDPTGEYSADLSALYPSEAPPYEAVPGTYADAGAAYGHQQGYEPGQVVTGAIYHQDGQPAYAQGHVVYEHPPTAYYAHDPYYGTYQVAEGYQPGHVPYHPQYATPEYQHGYLAHDPYGQMAPVMHPVGAYGMQAPPIHYGAPVYGPVQPATASAIDPTHVTYQQQMYNMQVYGTPYDPSHWSAPPAQ